ncbi:hypothetical protein [Aeromicrobium sp. NPDC092404]|uniref:hypothetical protein n=1 Tax=Aeromicrobium sp. NPDC092404 TaxID=3154976 RepID=UPI0034422B89
MSDQQLRQRVAQARFWSWLSPLGNVVGVACGLVGVITDLFSTAVRVTIVVVGVVLWAIASVGAALVARAQRRDEETIHQLRSRLESAGVLDRGLPDHALRMIAPVVFRNDTSWRLTLFVLEAEGDVWYLRPRIRCASIEMYEAMPRPLISVESSVLRELKSRDLPAFGEQGDAPDRDISPDAWTDWQGEFIADSSIVKSLRMPTRKYAWCAARQPGYNGRTVALVAETIQPSGVNTDVLASNLMPPILEMVARLVDLPEAADPQFEPQ